MCAGDGEALSLTWLFWLICLLALLKVTSGYSEIHSDYIRKCPLFKLSLWFLSKEMFPLGQAESETTQRVTHRKAIYGRC